MLHPFAGILEAPVEPQADQSAGRRAFLRRGLGFVAGGCAALLGFGRSSQAQIYTTQALHEEGGWRSPPSHRSPGRSYYPAPRGYWHPPHRHSPPHYSHPPHYSYPPRNRVTTQAVGEEGGRPPHYSYPPPHGGVTTQAVGEEGGHYYYYRYR